MEFCSEVSRLLFRLKNARLDLTSFNSFPQKKPERSVDKLICGRIGTRWDSRRCSIFFKWSLRTRLVDDSWMILVEKTSFTKTSIMTISGARVFACTVTETDLIISVNCWCEFATIRRIIEWLSVKKSRAIVVWAISLTKSSSQRTVENTSISANHVLRVWSKIHASFAGLSDTGKRNELRLRKT